MLHQLTWSILFLVALAFAPIGLTSDAHSGSVASRSDASGADRFCLVLTEASSLPLTPAMVQESQRLEELTGKPVVYEDIVSEECFNTEKELRDHEVSLGIQGIPGVESNTNVKSGGCSPCYYVATLYDNTGYSGTKADYVSSIGSCAVTHAYHSLGYMDNLASSASSEPNCTGYVFYRNVYGGTPYYCAQPDAFVPRNCYYVGSAVDNQISSFAVY